MNPNRLTLETNDPELFQQYSQSSEMYIIMGKIWCIEEIIEEWSRDPFIPGKYTVKFVNAIQ